MMLRLPSTAALLLTAMSGLCRADADFLVNNRPYRLVTAAKTWDAAEADAIAQGGHLVRIASADENAKIFAAVQAAGGVTTTAADGGNAVYFWIGGKETSEGTYAWATDLASPCWVGGKTGSAQGGAYTNWGTGTLGGSAGPEPDNSAGLQNRAAMGYSAWPASGATKIGQPGQWNDVRDTNALAYVIEFDGIFADFTVRHGTTPMGTFTCKLFPDIAPLAVANFVSLAEGTRPFVDEAHGTVAQRPYFDGLVFHRVIAGFMNQGGCPRGDGTSGPGWKFPDEFSPSVRHDKAGRLSMANSGKTTNGSQFFVTVEPTPWLNDVHTIFGEVVAGYNEVVVPVNSVAVNASSKPLEPVVLESVRISRKGAAALAFDTTTANVPSAALVAADAGFTGGHCLLDYNRQPHRSYVLLQSGDLGTWSMTPDVEYSGATPAVTPFDTFPYVPAASARRFFQVAEVRYPGVALAPVSAAGMRVTLTDPNVVLAHDLPTATTGSYAATPTGGSALTGAITDYVWTPGPWSTRLVAYIGGSLSVGGTGIYYLDYKLTFTSGTGGTFSGDLQDVFRSSRLPVSGTFTLTDLP